MSFLYVGKEDNTVEQTLDKKLIYFTDSENEKYKNLVDFNFGEKFLYGRVRRNFRTIYLNSNSEYLKNLGAINPQASPPQALNFVVDMFERLNTQFLKCSTIGTIRPDDPFLSNLSVYKAYQDPVSLHTSYLQKQFGILSKQLKGKKFDNLSFFLEEILNLLSQTLKLYPITFAGFVNSRLCPIFSSGLCLEIADSNYFDDQGKIEQFYNSPNWEFYLNSCRSYGFMIDKNIPWRIVADIGSSETLQYSRQYDLVDTNSILSLAYNETEMFFFNKLKFYILNLYNLIATTFAEPYDCDGIQRTQYTEIPQININFFDKQINEEAMLRFYFEIRILEADKKLSNGQKKKLINDCITLYKAFGVARSMNNFVKIIAQPFDSIGSLSYINERNKRQQEDT
jgi:hypothetical protein